MGFTFHLGASFPGVQCYSVLGPLLFSLYFSPLGQIIRSYGTHFPCYSDDTELDVSVKAEDHSQIRALLDFCEKLMSRKFLLLNSDKTEKPVIGFAKHRH